MRGPPDERLGLYLCEVLSQLGAARRALEPRVSVVTERVDNGPRRPLDGHHAHIGESGLCHLLLQPSGGMEKPSVNPKVGTVHVGDSTAQPGRDVDGEATALRPVKDRHKLSDGRGEQDPPGRRTRRASASAAISQLDHEMVELPEQEHCVDRRIRLREPAGIADLDGYQPLLKWRLGYALGRRRQDARGTPAAPRAQTPNGCRNSVVDAKASSSV
jgi:hypothetical protein